MRYGPDLRQLREGDTFPYEGRTWTVVRMASGSAKVAKRTRGHSHVIATADGGQAKMFANCQCVEPGPTVAAIDLVTEEEAVVCAECRAVRD